MMFHANEILYSKLIIHHSWGRKGDPEIHPNSPYTHWLKPSVSGKYLALVKYLLNQ